MPRPRRCGRGRFGVAGMLGCGRLVATEQKAAIARRWRARGQRLCHDFPVRFGRDSAPSRRATFFNSRTAIQRPSMIAPVQTPITPVRISVLPKLNSLTGIPKPIASRPAKTKPNPATNMTTIIELTPAAALETLASRQRHDTVILCASPTGNYGAGSPKIGPRLEDSGQHFAARRPARPRPYFYRLPIDMPYVALHQENYATIANYLERELRYMDAGE